MKEIYRDLLLTLFFVLILAVTNKVLSKRYELPSRKRAFTLWF